MSKSEQYVSASKIQERFGVSSSSLRRWDRDGKVGTIRTPGGFRLYSLGDIERLFNQEESDAQPQKKKICYARVSSEQQREDLERQIQDLHERFPEHEILQDIGSGLDYKRNGFQTLLKFVYEKSVSEVVITHKDRLCRYGFELVELIFKKTDTKLVVLGQSIEEQDSTRELADDLLSVCNHFVAKINGLRSGENIRKRKRFQEEEEGQGEDEKENERRKRTNRESEDDEILSDEESYQSFNEMVHNGELEF